MRWGLNGASALPDDVEEIEIVRCDREGQEETCTSPFTCTVEALTLGRAEGPVPGCRPGEGTEMYMDRPVLIRSGLPTDTAIRFILRGKSGGVTTYVGQAGPFVLGEGERRFVELRMFPLGQTVPLVGTSVGRFLHTATYLPDGRVLIAGGFDAATRLDSCPEEPAFPAEARCWELEATDRAVAYDVATGTVTPIRDAMLAPRAGHTATGLPDGRVLLAGGAPRALLAMIPQGEGAIGGYRAEIVPRLADGTPGANASFELFDAFLGAEGQDADRDGDAGRGGFLGTAGTASPGALNHPRFLHAAAEVPSTPGRVLLVGGMGSALSSETYEVFDADKPGGFGVRRGPGNRLTVPRAAPGAVGLGGQVWIFGGRSAAGNEELAEVWSASMDDPNGSVMPASELGSFPLEVAGMEADYPEYSLLRPSVAAVDGGQRALVVGWYGPLCAEGSDEPLFSAGETTQVCNSPSSSDTRSFTVAASTGLTTPTPVRLHAFGATAELRDFQGAADGRVVAVTGGIANTSWGANAAVDLFTGDVDASGAAQVVNGPSLAKQRIFHTSTGVPGYGLVTVGGMSFSLGVDEIFFEDELEVVFLDR